MLDVSFNLAAVIVMLVGIVWPGHHIEVDSLNSPTARPIPDGKFIMEARCLRVKGRSEFAPMTVTAQRPIQANTHKAQLPNRGFLKRHALG